jgi:hypothetical protein
MSSKEWANINKERPEDFDPKRYNRTSIKNWVEKAIDETKNGVNSIILIPAAVDTKIWQKTIFELANSVCFIAGRVNFMAGRKRVGPSPMACALVYFGTQIARYVETFENTGTVIAL